MRIIFLNIYQGLIQRGAERSTEELCKRLGYHHQITLIQGGNNKNSGKYQIISLPVLFSKLPDSSTGLLRKFYLDDWSLQILFFTIFAIPFLLKSRFDILIPVNGGWQTLICKIISFIKKCKLVIIGRAGIGRDDAWNLLLKPDLFIALTKRGEEWAKKREPEVRIVTIPNGVDLEMFNPRISPARIYLPPPVIIAAAALTPNKRLELTIKAVTAMKKKASLLILGSGPLFKKLSSLGNTLLGNSRFKIIPVSLTDIPHYYRVGKLFSLASVENEAFGNVYLETLACNLPVVAPAGYRREIIGKAGLYFRQNSITAYAKSLDQALNINFGNFPRRQAEKFSWHKIIPLYEKNMGNLLKK
ncbi:hypothetical protein A3D78_01070 [Candidatus Gottesmanbacteria bacterium RIFCSPHIGHO2_02_FULL_39_14]|uniref:Glycosyl transferase family 1 domain-containing protein n=2 Tax=Candidatus Gottesmaniibacteriota TaxID=1752720 RepID=A0A1F6A049_9BACT|nr:MAG: hypothetical protein A2153_05280 [Candidatus Gottesmanbacteria bacterium RBG_16_38_7b]OGG18071.1 MAG: hypothetical protein A3D78_01070 [Candidatus Gottesmanbacteria bacterium RIFCSPHIGHO2_02_FULL_39_14]